MYIILYQFHKVAIIIFILIYLIKGILILTNKDALSRFTKIIRIPEMITAFIFLITGVGLLIETSEIRNLFIAKLVLVGISIPVAVIAYRKMSKPLAVLAAVMLIGVYGLAEMNKYSMVKRPKDLPAAVVTDNSRDDYNAVTHGKALYETQCVHCHGQNGDLRMSGAMNLTESKLNKEQIISIMNAGAYTMPPYDGYYSTDEIAAIADYVLTFQTP